SGRPVARDLRAQCALADRHPRPGCMDRKAENNVIKIPCLCEALRIEFSAMVSKKERSKMAAELGRQGGKATVKAQRELAVLKRMFSLARKATPAKVVTIPYIPMLKESNTRTGFLESRQHDLLAKECASIGLWLRAMFEVGLTYGWRHSELLNLRVRQLNIV